jgi:hypothetical protein
LVTFHDGGVEFDKATTVEDRAHASIISGVVFEDAHRGFDSIHGTATIGQYLPPGITGGATTVSMGGDFVIGDGPGATMYDDCNCHVIILVRLKND